jgi:hypothetical protein
MAARPAHRSDVGRGVSSPWLADLNRSPRWTIIRRGLKTRSAQHWNALSKKNWLSKRKRYRRSFASSVANAAEINPLRPVDTSSPRATLQGFAATMDDIYLGMKALLQFSGVTRIGVYCRCYYQFRASRPDWAISYHLGRRLILAGSLIHGRTQRPSPVQVKYVISTTISGFAQCTRDSSRGEPNRLGRGGGMRSGILPTASGFNLSKSCWSWSWVMPVPTRPAQNSSLSGVTGALVQSARGELVAASFSTLVGTSRRGPFATACRRSRLARSRKPAQIRSGIRSHLRHANSMAAVDTQERFPSWPATPPARSVSGISDDISCSTRDLPVHGLSAGAHSCL